MKIYLGLLSFAWGICCLMPLATAKTPEQENTQTSQDTTEAIEATLESSTEDIEDTEVVEGESSEIETTETNDIEEKTPQQELEAAFPGCPVVADDNGNFVLAVSTVTPNVPEEEVPEEGISEAASNPKAESEAVEPESKDTPQELTEQPEIDSPTISSQEDLEAFEPESDESPSQEIAEQPETDSQTISETDSDDDSQAEDATVTADEEPEPECPTAEELERYQQFVKADKLYKAGDKVAAAEIYRELKEAWTVEVSDLEPAIYETDKLSPGGNVYWRTYQKGKEQNLSSKIFVPLELITNRDPNFIPGHITYAQELIKVDKVEQAHLVMERAIGLYPNEATLLKAKIEQDAATERWLEASIAARQFALFNPEHPDTDELAGLADRYLQAYKDQVREELTWNAIGNAITGFAGFALTGNIFGPISAVETTLALLQGEDKLGSRFAKRAAKHLPLVEDEEILNYVQRIGDEIAAVAGRDEFEYEFYVIMDDNLNAFALPGGKIFINLGAIMETDSESELAGLLAHEVAHSVLSHGFQLVTRGSLTANVAQYIPYIGSTAGNLIVLNYSRDMERQADIFGTRILVAADYSADGVKNLMENLVRSHEESAAETGIERSEPPAWLSTHPLTEQRIAYIKELIISNKLNRYAYEGVEEHQLIKVKSRQVWQEYQAEQNADKESKQEKETDENTPEAKVNPETEVDVNSEAEANPEIETDVNPEAE